MLNSLVSQLKCLNILLKTKTYVECALPKIFQVLQQIMTCWILFYPESMIVYYIELPVAL